jgi:steroid delta-isomerase-like uncharacterized protein
MSEQNKRVARRLCEDVIGGGEVGLIDELVASEYLGHGSSPEFETHGREGYRQFVLGLRGAFPDLQLKVEDQIAEGDTVVTRWVASGTHRGSFYGVPPSGRQGSMSGITLERMVDGMSQECWTNSDDLGLLRQIGAIPG